ncbi:hypothetical protein F4778DRAFT_743720, partial [Xylariomycetidae sp. FL2044]
MDYNFFSLFCLQNLTHHPSEEGKGKNILDLSWTLQAGPSGALIYLGSFFVVLLSLFLLLRELRTTAKFFLLLILVLILTEIDNYLS